MPLPIPTKELKVLKGHEGPVHHAKYSADGNYVLTASADRTVRLWNPITGMCIKKYESHGKDVFGVAVPTAPGSNSKFASCGADRQIIQWDVASGRPTRRFTGHHQRVNAIAYNEDANVIVSGSYDATVRAWDCRANTKTPIQVLDQSKDSIEAVQIVGNEILTGSVDGFVRVYDVRMGSITQDRVGQPVTSCCFSGDRNCILVATLDSTIRLFDKESGEMLSEYKGHRNTDYRSIATLSNTDGHVFGGSEDGSIHVWDLVEGTQVHLASRAHTRAVSCITYHPQRVLMISAGQDGVVKSWAGVEEVFED